MRLYVGLLVLVLLGFTTSTAMAACEGSLPANSGRAINPNNPDLATFSASVRYYTNVERCRRGLNAVQGDPALFQAALGHSIYMARARNLSHTSNVSGARTMSDRMRKAGVSKRTAGENIGQNFLFAIVGRNISSATSGACKFTYADTGQPVPQHSYSSLAQAFVSTWMASSGHRDNLLNRRFDRMEAAFGFAPDAATCGQVYASQNFAG